MPILYVTMILSFYIGKLNALEYGFPSFIQFQSSWFSGCTFTTLGPNRNKAGPVQVEYQMAFNSSFNILSSLPKKTDFQIVVPETWFDFYLKSTYFSAVSN